MDEGHISVLSTIQKNRKQNASNREDFKQYVRLSWCDCGNAQTNNQVQTNKWWWPAQESPIANSTNSV